MPSIRKPLSTRQKLIALYSDPNAYALAEHVALTAFGTPPGHPDHARNVTCFLLDVEARIHSNRQRTQAHGEGLDDWQLRRHLAVTVTGEDLLLSVPPSQEVVRKWRSRFVPIPKAKEPLERCDALQEFIVKFDELAMRRAKQLGQFHTRKRRNLARLRPRHMACADGTYLRGHSLVQPYEGEDGKERYAGSRAKNNPRVQRDVTRKPKGDRQTMGVNFVAILTRSRYGRVILTVERAQGHDEMDDAIPGGGEMHAALRGMDRVAPLAVGGIWALGYDGALSGWQQDYLFAHHGILSLAPQTHASAKAVAEASAEKKAEAVVAQLLASRGTAATTAAAQAPQRTKDASKRSKKPAFGPGVRARIKADVVHRVLGERYCVDAVLEDARAGRPLGAGLPPGVSIYLSSHNHVVPVDSIHDSYLTTRHRVGSELCAHELHVDDGGLWDTRVQDKVLVKDQRLKPIKATAVWNARTGWYQLRTVYRFTCQYTGEILTETVHHTPSGEWRAYKSRKKTTPRHLMQVIARCDRRWGRLYGLRNDCESWFSWLKSQMLEDQRAASLDLNHQLLDVFYAALITNSIAYYHYLCEGNR